MALKFKCTNCGEDILSKGFGVGDIVRCGTCDSLERVPSDAKIIDDQSLAKGFTDTNSIKLTHGQYNWESDPKPYSATGLDLIKGIAIIWSFNILIYGVFRALIKLNFLDKVDSTIYLHIFDSIFTISVIWFFTCNKYHRPLFDGFGIFSVSFSTIIICVIVGFGIAVLNIYLGELVRPFFPIKDTPLNEFISKPKGFVNFLFIAMTYGPIIEEIYYRGFIFPVLQKEISSFRAILYVGLWFGLIHGSQVGGDILSILSIMTAGFILTYIRCKTASLIPSILIHLAYNISLFIVTLVVSFLKLGKLIGSI